MATRGLGPGQILASYGFGPAIAVIVLEYTFPDARTDYTLGDARIDYTFGEVVALEYTLAGQHEHTLIEEQHEHTYLEEQHEHSLGGTTEVAMTGDNPEHTFDEEQHEHTLKDEKADYLMDE